VAARRVQPAGLFVFSESHFSISDGLTILLGVTGFSVPALTSDPAAILAAANCLASATRIMPGHFMVRKVG
jgi:hypothetical protein